MVASLTIVRYPKWLAFAGFLSMALFRLPLWLNQSIKFWKLMGTGKNGSFDKTPDLSQWAILCIWEESESAFPGIATNEFEQKQFLRKIYGKWICAWWHFWGTENWTILLQPLEGHGNWDAKEPFGQLPKTSAYEGPIAILTRATIRLNKLKSFWENVPAVASRLSGAPGFLASFGIGEIPWIKQATFSIWDSKQAMRDFAYKMQEHATVIQKTKKEDWYSEELFVRFKPIHSWGTLKGIDPLKRKP